MLHALLPTILLYLVAPSLLSSAQDILKNNHLYLHQNMKLLHMLSFLLETLFPLKKDSYVSLLYCVILHALIHEVMSLRFAALHFEDSILYDSFYLPSHNNKPLLQILIPPLGHQSLLLNYFLLLA